MASYFLIAGIIFFQVNGDQWLLEKVFSFGHFFLLGLGGAIVANATGAGGGIVFVPAFSTLGLSPSETLSTSIMIQCFGMTAGTISWFVGFKNRATIYQRYRLFLIQIVLTAGLSSVTGAILSQLWFRSAMPMSMLSVFSTLSILFGLILLFSNLRSGSKIFPKTHMVQTDYMLIIPLCFFGGVITSMISIGVGEILLVVLLLRKYPMHISIFVAVFISAITVIACAPHQIFIEQTVAWDIVAFAAPSAIIGGVLGRYFSMLLGASRIKIFCAIWILTTGILI
ncbi:MAG: sulfite exporter TauE/SafE family protein [Mariprofundaceae bacterium]